MKLRDLLNVYNGEYQVFANDTAQTLLFTNRNRCSKRFSRYLDYKVHDFAIDAFGISIYVTAETVF